MSAINVTNLASFAAILLGIVLFIVQSRRHPGLEPSPYVPGRVWKGAHDEAVQSQDTDDFVDVGDPPASEDLDVGEDAATSTVTTK